jgi:hypothetical protein
MRGDLLKRSNLIGNGIANASTQTVGDLRVLLGRLLPQREFRCDRHAIDGAQAGYDQRELPELIGAESR